ncbi:hypothetical protein D3C76_1254200 [compost metagenome]
MVEAAVDHAILLHLCQHAGLLTRLRISGDEVGGQVLLQLGTKREVFQEWYVAIAECLDHLTRHGVQALSRSLPR